jgi:hypothetical protein
MGHGIQMAGPDPSIQMAGLAVQACCLMSVVMTAPLSFHGVLYLIQYKLRGGHQLAFSTANERPVVSQLGCRAPGEQAKGGVA